MKKILSLFITAALAIPGIAQIKTPTPSPKASITQEVGLTEISITYSRPGVKGRKIFGELVQYGQMWRTGANASSKITFGEPVKINGKDLAAGTYAFYTIPGKDEWTLIFHKNLTYWGTGGDKYNTDEDALRIKVKPENYPVLVESMTFDIADITDNSCKIELKWENTMVSFNVEMDVDSKVMADIDQAMKGVSSSTYYQAARYYLEHDKDLNKALEWINKSMEGGNDKFWMLRQKALILAKLERYKDAIDTANASIAKAKEANNSDYVRMNEKSIAEWKKKL
jgi:hypothetical protein